MCGLRGECGLFGTIMLLEKTIPGLWVRGRDNTYPLRRRGTAIAALIISVRLGDLEEL